MRRTVDAANVTINATQLAAVIGIAFICATGYQKIIGRLDGLDQRYVQIQDQVGEVNARLATLERPVNGR